MHFAFLHQLTVKLRRRGSGNFFVFLLWVYKTSHNYVCNRYLSATTRKAVAEIE